MSVILRRGLNNYQIRWQTQPQRGELVGMSATAAGDIVGLAIAELFTQTDSGQAAELLSWYVLPAYRHQGIGTGLVNHIQQFVGAHLNSQAFK